jgi:hypothetical protein
VFKLFAEHLFQPICLSADLLLEAVWSMHGCEYMAQSFGLRDDLLLLYAFTLSFGLLGQQRLSLPVIFSYEVA